MAVEVSSEDGEGLVYSVCQCESLGMNQNSLDHFDETAQVRMFNEGGDWVAAHQHCKNTAKPNNVCATAMPPSASSRHYPEGIEGPDSPTPD